MNQNQSRRNNTPNKVVESFKEYGRDRVVAVHTGADIFRLTQKDDGVKCVNDLIKKLTTLLAFESLTGNPAIQVLHIYNYTMSMRERERESKKIFIFLIFSGMNSRGLATVHHRISDSITRFLPQSKFLGSSLLQSEMTIQQPNTCSFHAKPYINY